jgi:hypothetical protein
MYVYYTYSQGKTRVSYKAVVVLWIRVANQCRAEPMLMFAKYLHAVCAFIVKARL